MKKTKHRQKTAAKRQYKMDKGLEGYGRLALLVAVGILLFYPPYFRGLFFAREMLVTHVATTLVFILWCISLLKTKDLRFSIGPLDWLVLGYAVVYCLSVIGAVDTRQALSGALKALNYGLIYFLVAQITLDLKTFKNWLVVLYASAVGVALIGIGCATGYVNYPAGFDGQNIASTLQYINTTSVYMALMAIIGVTLALTSEKFWWQVLYSFTTSLLILVSVNAASKGAWLIFILALILFLVGMPTAYRFKSVYVFVVTLAAGLVASEVFMSNVQSGEPLWAIVSLGLALVIVVLANLLWRGGVRFYQTQGKWKTVIASTTAALLALGAGWLYIGEKTLSAFGNISEEMRQLTNVQGSSFVYRWEFSVDALKIIKDNPLLGTGAGGWNLLYHQYQDFLYWTTEVHNHLLQVGVETGILGMLIWLGLFAVLAYYIYRIRKNGIDTSGKVLVWGVGTTIFALGAHSLIDFNLSIPSMQILFFALLGLIASAHRPQATTLVKRPHSNRALLSGVGVSLVMALLAGSFLIAISMSNQGVKMAKAGNYQSALVSFQKASMFDPFNSQYHAAQARFYTQLYAAQAGGDSLRSQWFKLGVHHASLAEEKSPYDPKLMSELSGTYGLLGSSTDAIRLYERVVELNPWDINAYNYLASIYATHAIRHLEAGDMQNADKYIELALATPQRIEQQANQEREDLLHLWRGARLAPNSTTTYILAQAHYYRGDYQTALQKFEGLLSQTFAKDDEFKTLYAAALYKNGRQAEAEQVMADCKTSSPEMYTRYVKIRDLPAIPRK